MSGVRKLSAAAMIAALVAGLIVAGSGAAAPKVHRYTAHARLVVLDLHTSVGDVTGPGSGKYAAQIAHFTLKGNTVSGTNVSYDSGGSTVGPFTITLKTNADGSTTYTGTATITGGTGLYRGAKGTVKVSGHAAKNATIGYFTYQVTVKY